MLQGPHSTEMLWKLESNAILLHCLLLSSDIDATRWVWKLDFLTPWTEDLCDSCLQGSIRLCNQHDLSKLCNFSVSTHSLEEIQRSPEHLAVHKPLQRDLYCGYVCMPCLRDPSKGWLQVDFWYTCYLRPECSFRNILHTRFPCWAPA